MLVAFILGALAADATLTCHTLISCLHQTYIASQRHVALHLHTSLVLKKVSCLCCALQGFLAEGLQRTSAGLGSVIIDSQPLSVAVLAALLFGEALSGLGIAGLFIGVGGLLLLEVPQDVLLQGLGPLADSAAQSSVISSSSNGWGLLDSGEFWMLLAAQSMAVGTVMVR